MTVLRIIIAFFSDKNFCRKAHCILIISTEGNHVFTLVEIKIIVYFGSRPHAKQCMWNLAVKFVLRRIKNCDGTSLNIKHRHAKFFVLRIGFAFWRYFQRYMSNSSENLYKFSMFLM